MTASNETKPSNVFCHGIWADGSCFGKVIPAPQAKGYEVNRNRRVPLSRAALDVLEFHRLRSMKTGPMDLVFSSRRGTPIRPDNVLKRVIRPACDRLKIPTVGWHGLRHTHATMLSELGEPVKVAQRFSLTPTLKRRSRSIRIQCQSRSGGPRKG
jgi:integrase